MAGVHSAVTHRARGGTVKCPECSTKARVVHLEHRNDGSHRWHQCPACGHKFRSLETHYNPPPTAPRRYGAVLFPENVAEIRRRVAAGELQAVIADEFGMSRSTISKIIQRETWKDVA